MKTKTSFGVCCLVALAGFFMTTSVVRAEPGVNSFVLGFDLTISPDYRDLLEELYPDDEIVGGMGWVGVSAGIDIPLSPVLSVIPGAAFRFNFVDATDDTYANTMIVPSAALKWRIRDELSTPFIRAEVNYNITNLGADEVDDAEGGLGFGIMAGYQTESGFDFGLGYAYIPVDVSGEGGYYDYYYDEYSDDEETYNFGGFVMSFSKTF